MAEFDNEIVINPELLAQLKAISKTALESEEITDEQIEADALLSVRYTHA